MTSINNSIDTINAAASAIVYAESRVQPTTVQKRWGSCWSFPWCFGSYKNKKRITHAVLIAEAETSRPATHAVVNQVHSTTSILPFIAPPSSPTAFLQSDPSSASQSPTKSLSSKSIYVHAYSPSGPANIYATGPYAHETQLVSPPVFSTYTTEPSTAPFTPPSEYAQFTTPSSPEVPFSQLLTSSLERARRKSSTKLGFSHYELQSYQIYPASYSPGGYLISPGSAVSNSGTSSPFPNKYPVLGFHLSEATKLFGLEHVTKYKLGGSGLSSGSLTPDGAGVGLRLRSDGMGLGSKLGSGTTTPDGIEQCSRPGSGALTPIGGGFCSKNNHISEVTVASLTYLETGSKCENNNVVVDHRVSFELSGEDVARCFANKALPNISKDSEAENEIKLDGGCIKLDGGCCGAKSINEVSGKYSVEAGNENFYIKHRSITLGSIKEFDFDNTIDEVSDKSVASSEGRKNGFVTDNEVVQENNNWTFFPLLLQGVSGM